MSASVTLGGTVVPFEGHRNTFNRPFTRKTVNAQWGEMDDGDVLYPLHLLLLIASHGEHEFAT